MCDTFPTSAAGVVSHGGRRKSYQVAFFWSAVVPFGIPQGLMGDFSSWAPLFGLSS